MLKPATNKIFVREPKDHPYESIISSLALPVAQLYSEEFEGSRFEGRTMENVPLHWIETEAALEEFYEKVSGEKVIAVDLEHHSFHSYRGLLSLIQVSTYTEDFLIDPIKLREVLQTPEMSLNRILTDGGILKLFHGAESDIAWLQRDFDCFIVNMFDSYHAAKILELPRMSLAYLLEEFCGVELDKKYQLADWRERPLPAEMVEYARKDTHYLIQLYFLLKQRLSESQFGDVLLRSNRQCLTQFTLEEITEKSWKSVLDRSNFPLDADQAKIVRKIFYWREEKAKELDVSPPALMLNSYIVKIAYFRAKNEIELRANLRNISDLMSKQLASLAQCIQAEEVVCEEEVKEGAGGRIESVEMKRSHIRFEEEETGLKEQQSLEPVELEAKTNQASEERVLASAEKKLKKDSAPVVIKRVSKISFAAGPVYSASALFTTTSATNSSSATSSSPDSRTVLTELVRESLPSVDESNFNFITKKEAEEVEKQAQEQAQVHEREVEETEGNENVAMIHGTNKKLENLEIAHTNSNSTLLVDQLRKDVKRTEGSEIVAVDYSNFSKSVLNDKKEEDCETVPVPIFDPYHTISRSSGKGAFIEATIAPANGPRLSTTPQSGNRMVSFTKTKKKKP